MILWVFSSVKPKLFSNKFTTLSIQARTLEQEHKGGIAIASELLLVELVPKLFFSNKKYKWINDASINSLLIKQSIQVDLVC